MSYGLYKYITVKELAGDTSTKEYQIELWKKAYSGSTEQLEGADNYFEHEYTTIDSRDPFREPVNNATLSMFFHVQNQSHLDLLEEIQDADEDEFLLKKKDGVSYDWQGKVVNDLVEYQEGDYPFIGVIRAKDLSYLKSQEYPLSTGYEKIIVTLADVLSGMGFGIGIKTHTNWVENNSTTSDDFLNQVYHDKYAFRNYSTDSTVDDQPISKYEVLENICRNYQLILRQVEGQWYFYQLSELEDPTNLNIFSYSSSGTQTGSTTQDITRDVDNSDLYSLPSGSNQTNPAIKKAKVVFDHRTGTTEQFVNASIISTLTDPDIFEAKFDMDFNGSGDEFVLISGKTFATTSRNYLFTNDDFPQTSYLLKSSQYYWIDQASDWQEVADITTQRQIVSPSEIDSVNNKIRLVSNEFSHGDIVRLESGFSAGTDANTEYYLIDVSGEVATGSNTLYYQLSETPDGTPVSIGSDSGSDKYVYRVNNRKQMGNSKIPFGGVTWFATWNVTTSNIPADSDDDVQFYAMPCTMPPITTDGTANQYWEYADTNNQWRPVTVSVRDVVTSNGDSIIYELEQTSNFSTELNYDGVYFGDGPLDYSKSALAITTTTVADTPTSQWDFRADSVSSPTNSNFFKIWLKEVLNFQRTNKRTLSGNLYGIYEGYEVLNYDSTYFFFLGGVHTGNGNTWSGDWVEINIETGTDTFTSYVDSSNSLGSGGGTGSSTYPATEGEYLLVQNNLSDLNSASTARDNLQLGADDDVIFGTLELGDNVSEDGTIKMWLSSIPDDANITLDNNGGVARFRLDSDTVVEGDLWVDNEVTTARLRTPEITNLAGTAAVWSTSSAVWDTSSLTWTNDVILLNGGISISDTLEVVGGTNMQGNVTLDNDLTVLGTTNLASITSSALTAGRVVLAGTSGVLEDSANLTFNGSLLEVTGQIGIDNTAAVSGNSFQLLGANGNITIPHTGETIELYALTGNTAINAGTDNLEINAVKTFINQATDIDGALYLLTTLRVDGSVDINNRIDLDYTPASPGFYALDIQSSEEDIAKFNSTNASASRITLQSSSADVLDIEYNVSAIDVDFKAYNNANINFRTEDSLGFDVTRLKIGNGTGISAFYGEQFNFGDVSGDAGKVKILSGSFSSGTGDGELIFQDSTAELAKFYQLGPNFNFQSDTGFRFEVDKNNPGTVEALLLESTGNAKFSGDNVEFAGTLDSTSFTKGTGNTGWVIDGSAGFAIEKDGSSLYNAYFDTLTVRGTLRVFELIAKQISTIGGTELLTVGNGVIESVSGSLGFETVTLEDPNGTGTSAFASGDLVVIQRFNPNNPSTLVKSEWREVVTSSLTTITLQDSTTALSLAGAPAGTSALEPGDYIVIFGNWNTPAVRGNIIYRSVLNDPIVRVQEDIKTYAEFTSPINSTRIAYGDINGFGGFSSRTYGFFAGTNTDNHVTITSSGMQFRNASNVLAELASNRFLVGDATSYVRFDGATSKIEMAADTFNLATTNLTIDSLAELITLGTSPNVVSIGKIGTSPADQFGISLDATNYWYNSGGNTYISIGSATDYLQFDTSSGNLDIATNNFALTANGIEVDSAGTGIADTNVILTSSSLSVDFKSATSGSPVISPNFSISDTERIRILQIVFDYDISGGDASYDIRIEPQFRNASTSVWSNPAMNLPIISYPAAANSYFNTNTVSATLTDESTGFITQFKIVSGVSSVTDKVAIYIVADENSIDYSTYDAFRFRVYHQGGAEVIGSFTADLYIRKYAASTAINPDGFTIRHCDTLWQETDVLSDGLPVRQDKSLIFV